MVSDWELVDRLREILGGSDLYKATARSVRRQLEEEFGVDLSDRNGFVREQIDEYLQSMEHAEEGEDGEKIKSEERTGPASEDVSTTGKEGAEAEDEGRMEKGKGKKRSFL